MQTILHSIMKAAKAKPSSNKGLKASFYHAVINATYQHNIQISTKMIIGGADQSRRKIGFMAFFGLVGLQDKI